MRFGPSIAIGIAFALCMGMSWAQPGCTYGPPGPSIAPAPAPAPTPAPAPGPTGGGAPTPGGPTGGGGPTTGGGTGGSGTGGLRGGATGGPMAGPVTPVRVGPTGPSGPATPGVGGRTGGPAARPKITRTANWLRWWNLHEERFLQLKGSVRARASASDDRDEFLGQSEGGADLAELTARRIRAEILPALMEASRDASENPRSASLIALAKTAESDDAEALAAILAALAESSQDLQESACVAAGLLGAPSAMEPLLQIVEGKRPEGLNLRGGIAPRVRYAAGMGLGLIGRNSPQSIRPAMIERLLAVARGRAAQSDAAIGATVALQLFGDELSVPGLLQIVRDEAAEDLPRAQAALALGKLRARQAVFDLRQAATGKAQQLARSAIVALGLLCPADDVESLQLLETLALQGKDAGERQFAMLSLGEIGGPRARATLLRILETRRVADERSFAALALGLSHFRHQDLSGFEREKLVQAFTAARIDDERAALCLSIALAGGYDAIPLLREGLTATGQPALQAATALALGMLEDRASAKTLRTLLAETTDPEVAKAAAKGLGLLRDPEAIGTLTTVFARGSSNLPLLGAAALALGHVGDRKSVPLLTKTLAARDSKSPLERAFAAIALGLLGDKDHFSRLSELQEHSNFLALIPVQADLLSIL